MKRYPAEGNFIRVEQTRSKENLWETAKFVRRNRIAKYNRE